MFFWQLPEEVFLFPRSSIFLQFPKAEKSVNDSGGQPTGLQNNNHLTFCQQASLCRKLFAKPAALLTFITQDDDSYLGYSTTTGKEKIRIVKNKMIFCINTTLKPGEFNGDGDRLDVAVGMPRGANLTGKVVLNNSSASFMC